MMKVFVISSTEKFHTEIPVLIRMFQLGLTTFHLRKPKWSTSKLSEYIESIPKEYHKHIIIHSHHSLVLKYDLKGIHITRKHRKKMRKTRLRIMWYKLRRRHITITRTFHKLSDLVHHKEKYNYVFLTPVYEGISKNSHSGGFSRRAVEKMLQKTEYKVYGMGGIAPDKFEDLHSMGFAGGCLLGALWEAEGDKVEIYKECVREVKRLHRIDEAGGVPVDEDDILK